MAVAVSVGVAVAVTIAVGDWLLLLYLGGGLRRGGWWNSRPVCRRHGESAIPLLARRACPGFDQPRDPLTAVAVILLGLDDFERLLRLQAKPVDLLCHLLGHEEHLVIDSCEHVLGIAELRIAELALGELEGALDGDIGLKLDLLEGHCLFSFAL